MICNMCKQKCDLPYCPKEILESNKRLRHDMEKMTKPRIKLETLAEIIVNACDTHEDIDKLCIALLDANMKSRKV